MLRPPRRPQSHCCCPPGLGYEHYEVSNYAKPGYRCTHNMVYWEGLPYYAFGMGAASYLQVGRVVPLPSPSPSHTLLPPPPPPTHQLPPTAGKCLGGVSVLGGSLQRLREVSEMRGAGGREFCMLWPCL